MSCCYQFELFPKGLQVKFEKQNTATRIFIPFSQILSIRMETSYDDKMSYLTLVQPHSQSHTFPFKTYSDAERLYNQLLQTVQ